MGVLAVCIFFGLVIHSLLDYVRCLRRRCRAVSLERDGWRRHAEGSALSKAVRAYDRALVSGNSEEVLKLRWGAVMGNVTSVGGKGRQAEPATENGEAS
jgi:hypothetical protein